MAWKIVVPTKTELYNLVTNPSFETGTDGYTAVGGSTTLLRQVAGPRGIQYLAVTPGTGVNDGVYFGTVSLTNATTYTFSVDLKGEVNFKIYFANTLGTLKGTATSITDADPAYWKRYSVTWTCDSTTSYRLYIVKDNSTSTSTFHIDGLCVVPLAYDVTYFDGDTPNCRWESTAHASRSIADPQARNVGRVVNLSDYNLQVLSMDGVGVVDATHHVTQRALLPGAEYKGHKVQPRYFLLTSLVTGSGLEDLHSKRKDLIDLFKHDALAGDQPVILRYSGANSAKEAEITCYLDTEKGIIKDEPNIQNVALRLVAYDPYFYTPHNTSQSLSSIDSGTRRYFMAKRSGWWTSITPSAVTDPGSGIRVRDIEPTGSYYKKRWFGDANSMGFQAEKLYVSGSFLNWDGTAASDYIAQYDFSTEAWSAVGSGANGYVRAMAYAPNGYLYVCGEFTSIGGTAANRVAYWNGSSWNAMGTGFDNTAYDIMVASDGNVYAVGNDSTIGGVTGAAYVAYWDGSSWNAMSSGISATAYCLDQDGAGNIIIGGTQTGYVTKWDGSAFTSLSAPAACWALKVHPNGTIYAGLNGDELITQYNGKSWVSMAGGITGSAVYSIDVDQDGLVWVGGDFTAAGGLSVNGLVCWNGYNFVHPDVTLPGTATCWDVKCVNNDLYLGFNTSGTAYFSYQNYYVTNNGTARAYPKITINTSGGTILPKYLKNESTGATIWMDGKIFDGETLTLDFSEGVRGVYSSFYGNKLTSVLRGSAFTDFYLLPGNNIISLYITQPGSPTVTEIIQWQERHESIDGTAA
jgi:hypothetical protein